ncbi:peptide/nickel transport system permease protein [Ochrobactrum sp. 19YEA23]|uniref:ABC transporter permease n=1 Tax=Ochrobactrum sp. 19YEA23 TaxID=3039854 RepID=UPI002479B0EA|nr:peptide/nickel transport system permease protein [Ochrobactrum sp. 19YEA23]
MTAYDTLVIKPAEYVRERPRFGVVFVALTWVYRHAALSLSGAMLLLLIVSALWPGLLAPYDPFAVDTHNILAAPSLDHLFGTDENGRDVLSRIIYGAQSSLRLGFGAVLIALVGGIALGLAAALGNRLADILVMRTVDVGLAFPELLLALIVIALIGSGPDSAMTAIGIATIPSYARLTRAQALGVSRSTYVEAAHALGLGYSRVLWRHILPNAVPPILVVAAIGVGTATLAGAALSFIGLGVSPPEPEWGSMLAAARNFLRQAWWYGTFPGFAIILLVISTSVFGRQLQKRLEGRA